MYNCMWKEDNKTVVDNGWVYGLNWINWLID